MSGMIFRQLTHDDLGCASYLIGDEDAGVAAIFTPGTVVPEAAIEVMDRLNEQMGYAQLEKA